MLSSENHASATATRVLGESFESGSRGATPARSDLAASLTEDLQQIIPELEQWPMDEVIEIPDLEITVPDRRFSTASDVLLDANDENFDLAQYLFREDAPVPGDQSCVANRIEEAPTREPLNDGNEMQVDDFRIAEPKKHKRKKQKLGIDDHKASSHANMRLAAPVKSLDLKARKYVVQMDYSQSKSRNDEDESDVDVETISEGEYSASTLLALQLSNDLIHQNDTEAKKHLERPTNAGRVSSGPRLEISSSKRRKMLTKRKTEGMMMKRKMKSINLRRHRG